MYKKPRVERFGTFRDLTEAGTTGGTDPLTITCAQGNNLCGTPDFPCAPQGSGGGGF